MNLPIGYCNDQSKKLIIGVQRYELVNKFIYFVVATYQNGLFLTTLNSFYIKMAYFVNLQ